MLDEGLSWNNNVDLVKQKVSNVIGILYNLKNIFPNEVLLTLYRSLTASYLNYGLLLWGKQSHKVKILQKECNSSYDRKQSHCTYKPSFWTA